MKDFNPSQGFRPPEKYLDNDWPAEEKYWEENWLTRPYVTADLGFDYYRPGYRYGYESAIKYRGRTWDDVQDELRAGWDRYEHKASSTWERVKDAAREAWNRAVV